MADKGEIMRSKILYEFDMLMRKKGYKKATQRQLADICGISRGHVGFYFPQKEDMIFAMYRDYHARVNIILNKYVDLPEDKLLVFLIHILFSYYVVNHLPEVNRIASELSESVSYRNYRVQKIYSLAQKALQDVNFNFDNEDLLNGCICAENAVCAMINYWYLNEKPLDYKKVLCIFSDILFLQISFLKAKEYQEMAFSIFEKQDTILLLKEFKTLLDYNYEVDERYSSS